MFFCLYNFDQASLGALSRISKNSALFKASLFYSKDNPRQAGRYDRGALINIVLEEQGLVSMRSKGNYTFGHVCISLDLHLLPCDN